jgi:hypothetical protein
MSPGTSSGTHKRLVQWTVREMERERVSVREIERERDRKRER